MPQQMIQVSLQAYGLQNEDHKVIPYGHVFHAGKLECKMSAVAV